MTESATPSLDEAGLGAEVRTTVGRMYRRFRSERADGSLGDKALEVLVYLHKNGAQTLTALAAADQVTPASMSQTLNRLQSTGYVVRTPDPDDGRKVLFTTTTEGSELASTTRQQRNQWLESRLQRLTAEEQDLISRACRLLDRILVE